MPIIGLDALRQRRSSETGPQDVFDAEAHITPASRDGHDGAVESPRDAADWVTEAVARRAETRRARREVIDGQSTADPTAGADADHLESETEIGAPSGPDAGRQMADQHAADDEQAQAAAEAERRQREREAALGAVRDRWLDELAVLGGPATLLYFLEQPGTFIELTSAHPGGIAPLVAGKTVLLSNLIRENSAFRDARAAADRIARKGGELVSGRGLSSIALGTGLVEWTHEDIHHRAPILTRPISLRRVGRDYEVTLKGRSHVNASLVRVLFEQTGIRLLPRELLELARDTDSFLPQPVFDHVRHAIAQVPGATVAARVVVTSFGDVAAAAVRDARELDHPLLLALAGDADAVDALRTENAVEASASTRPVLSIPDPDHRDPVQDRLLLDADSEQEQVIDAIATGRSLAVTVTPGTGQTQTIVNAIGSLVAEGRRVLVVSPRSASLQAIRQRLRAIGLDGLSVTPRTLRRDAIATIWRNERAEKPQTADLDDALVRLRRVLADYRAALRRHDPALGVSVLDTLDALARLELADTPPSTTVRLDRDTIERLAEGRDAVAEQLREVGRLGEFRYGPDDSPWYGVAFEAREHADEAKATARQLADGRLWRLVTEAQELVALTSLRPAATLAELGIYLRLLVDVRETLDRFRPEVFDRSLADLIIATGPRREQQNELSSSRRRQLRQLAREYVRPGLNVGDLHEALTLVQRQRILWQRYSVDGSTPRVPPGIGELRARYRQLAEQLRLLDGPLVEAGYDSLADLPLEDLPERLHALAADSEVLQNLVERLRITEGLKRLGLEPLLTDLADRHIAADTVAEELELAWWQSVLEDALERDKALLGANTRTLARLENDFRIVDQAHTEANAARLRWQLAQEWKVALVDHPDEAGALRSLLRGAGVAPARLAAEAGQLAHAVTKVWLTTPYDVPLLPDGVEVDTVLLVDAAAITTAEALGAVRRGRQVVAFGDPVTQFPGPFSIAVQPDEQPEQVAATAAELERRADDSAYARLAALLPVLRLTHSYRAGGEDLTELVNQRFYEEQIHSLPWAGTFLGHPSLSVSFVTGGTGMPDPVSGAVESTDAEVGRVVELVIDHALHRPQESLLVVTASARHAGRVQQAVYSAVSKRPELADFFTEDRGEPFLSTTIEQASAQSRDRVIFSLGFGRTPHGKVLSSFGVLGTPAGRGALAVALTRARRSLVIVSCVRPDEFETSKLTPGTLALAQILAAAEPTAVEQAAAPAAPPMLVDLADRLQAVGMRTELDYRGRIPLVASFGGRAIAIDTDGLDGEVSAAEQPTLRESLRLRPELLKRLGWYYLRVHSFELFANPEAIAERIATALQVPAPELASGTSADAASSRGGQSVATRVAVTSASGGEAGAAVAAADLAIGRVREQAASATGD